MVDRLNPGGLPPPQGPQGPRRPDGVPSRPATPGQPARAGAPSFADVLQQQLIQTAAGVKFSAHAMERLRLRDIHLGPQDLARLDEAVRRAELKGARESLMLTDKGAFVVSVRNKTVITVVDTAHMKDNVFTNIDSAVIL